MGASLSTTLANSPLRLATKADGDAVWALLWEARSEIPLSPNFELADRRAWVAAQCARRRVWVVDSDSSIAAAMVIKGAEVLYLVVRPEAKRRGLARRLITHAKRWARRIGVEGLSARANPTNLPVISLLAAEGFRFDPLATAGDGGDWQHFFWASA